jgi:DHA2 family multidrug resistance protein
MGLWGVGVVFGPIIGPILGGILTDNLSWRWVFLINVPFGIMAVVGLILTMSDTRDENPPKLDCPVRNVRSRAGKSPVGHCTNR